MTHAAGTSRVRPAVRRAGLWLGPLLLVVLAWQSWDRYEAGRLGEAVGRLRAAPGERPLAPSSETQQDAGSYYLAAQFVTHSPRRASQLAVTFREALAGNGKVSDETMVEVDAILHANAAALNLVDEASELPFAQLSPTQDYVAKGMSFVFIDWVASLRTLRHLVRGDVDASTQSVISRIHYLRTFAREQSTFYGALKNDRVNAIASDLQFLVGRPEASAEDMAAIGNALDDVYAPDELAAAIRGEGLRIYESGSSMWGERPYSRGVPLARPLTRRGVEDLIATTIDAADAARLPWPQRLAALSKLPAGKPRLPAFMVRVASVPSVRDIGRGYDIYARRFAASLASLNAARTALRAESHRRSNGTIPAIATLGLDTATVTDPFSGKPLVLRATDDGFVVYSVGENGRDDGGQLVAPQPFLAGTHPAAPDVGVKIVVRRSG